MRYLFTKLAAGAELSGFPGQAVPVVLVLPDGVTRYSASPLPERAKPHTLGANVFVLDLPAAPTVADVEAHFTAASAPSPLDAARAAAAAAFNTLPSGKRALWEPVRAAVDAALSAGNPAEAVSIIQTVPEIYDDMETDRAAFLGLFLAH